MEIRLLMLDNSLRDKVKNSDAGVAANIIELANSNKQKLKLNRIEHGEWNDKIIFFEF